MTKERNHFNITIKITNLRELMYTLICIATAMIGYTIHHSFFYSVIDFLFAPLAWIYWLICHDVNVGVIKATFSFFFN